MDHMITSVLDVQIKDGVKDAPKYESHEFTMIIATRAVIVPRGTVGGNPTVDLQFVDEMGNKFVMMATGKIIETIGKVVESKRIQTNTN